MHTQPSLPNTLHGVICHCKLQCTLKAELFGSGRTEGQEAAWPGRGNWQWANFWNDQRAQQDNSVWSIPCTASYCAGTISWTISTELSRNFNWTLVCTELWGGHDPDLVSLRDVRHMCLYSKCCASVSWCLWQIGWSHRYWEWRSRLDLSVISATAFEAINISGSSHPHEVIIFNRVFLLLRGWTCIDLKLAVNFLNTLETLDKNSKTFDFVLDKLLRIQVLGVTTDLTYLVFEQLCVYVCQKEIEIWNLWMLFQEKHVEKGLRNHYSGPRRNIPWSHKSFKVQAYRSGTPDNFEMFS